MASPWHLEHCPRAAAAGRPRAAAPRDDFRHQLVELVRELAARHAPWPPPPPPRRRAADAAAALELVCASALARPGGLELGARAPVRRPWRARPTAASMPLDLRRPPRPCSSGPMPAMISSSFACSRSASLRLGARDLVVDRGQALQRGPSPPRERAAAAP